MNRSYRILTEPGFHGGWDAVPCASVDTNPWQAGGPLPPCEARVAFCGNRLHVLLKAWETDLRVVTHAPNGPVWEDSCVEFFLNPAPARDGRYLNFEINAEGVMLLGFGQARENRRLLDFDPALFGIWADVPAGGASAWKEPFYRIGFSIPVSFLEGLYGPLGLGCGSRLAGNFQKCGENTANPHYGCWNPILTPAPDFHRPEFFGDIIIG
jgi:hypothetical protein